MTASAARQGIKVCPASAVAPGIAHEEAVRFALEHADPYWGAFDLSHIQLCPQHPTAVSEELIDACRAVSPQTVFRLHASVRLTNAGPHDIYDASNAHVAPAQAYWRRVKELSAHAGAAVYSLHAGRRANNDLAGMYSNVRQLEDMLQLRVAVEGLYPDETQTWLLAGWDEYAWLLESGLDFALDLSHLNILAHRLGRIEIQLVEEMLSSSHCLEVHVSGNDGMADSHHVLLEAPWWLPSVSKANPEAVWFSEGCMRRRIIEHKAKGKRNE